MFEGLNFFGLLSLPLFILTVELIAWSVTAFVPGFPLVLLPKLGGGQAGRQGQQRVQRGVRFRPMVDAA